MHTLHVHDYISTHYMILSSSLTMNGHLTLHAQTNPVRNHQTVSRRSGQPALYEPNLQILLGSHSAWHRKPLTGEPLAQAPRCFWTVSLASNLVYARLNGG